MKNNKKVQVWQWAGIVWYFFRMKRGISMWVHNLYLVKRTLEILFDENCMGGKFNDEKKSSNLSFRLGDDKFLKKNYQKFMKIINKLSKIIKFTKNLIKFLQIKLKTTKILQFFTQNLHRCIKLLQCFFYHQLLNYKSCKSEVNFLRK